MPKNRSWIWFFVVLALLGTAAVTINWTYNASRQLTAEQLQGAIDLWSKNGPSDYDLAIEKWISSAATEGPGLHDLIEVRVRSKKVVDGKINGGPLPRDVWEENDMPAWFGNVEEFLHIDTKPGAPRTFRVADFDAKTGQLLRFRRRVSGTHQRQEVVFRVTPAGATSGK